MLPRTSRSSAQPVERPVLAPHWLTLLLAGMVGGALWLLYPRQDLERRLAGARDDSALSTAYLHNLLRSDPDNPQLRLLLAQRQATEGELEQARETLRPAADSTDPQLHRDAVWTLWEATYNKYQKTPSQEKAARDALRQDLGHQLGALAREDWPLAQHQQLTRQAFLLGARSEGILLLRGLASREKQPGMAASLYESAAREALAASNHPLSAELYLLARRSAPDAQAAKQYYLSAVAAMQSSGQAMAALELAEHELGELHDDPDTLHRLVQLARSAGRPDIAERYVKQLLRLALLLQWQNSVLAQAAPPPALPLQPAVARPAGIASALLHDGQEHPGAPRYHLAVQKTAPDAKAGPGLPFDDKTYALGYSVFLENRNLEDAWLVARAAVQQSPRDMVWRERLAQVSEWTLRLGPALEHWLVLARQTQKNAAWQAVLRLAPGQFDDTALIEALRFELQRQPGDPRLLQELVAAHERIGTPEPAIDVLRQQPRTPGTLEMLAGLAKRAGDLDTAFESWRLLFQDPSQITPERAMRAAVLALLRGQGAQGLAWLEAAQGQVTPRTENAPGFWRFTAQLAERQQKDTLATQAYRQLLDTEDADVGDFDALVRLLQTDQPLEAATIATLAWERYDEPRHLVQALTLYVSRSQWPDIRRLLGRIDPAPQAGRHALARLLREPEFLRLAGTYYQNTGQHAQARQYYEAGLRAAPQSSAMRHALLWLFIDSNDTVALRELLALHEPEWSRDEEVHDALASAYQALSLPTVALERYLQPRIASHQTDLLWLMNYADALDQNQQSDRAWRLRRHLLSAEWQKARQNDGGPRLDHAQARARWLTEEGLDEVRRLARTRLQLMQRPGDEGLETLRELLRLDRDARGGFSNAAAETAIGWLQDAGEYTAERGFLWHQYARSHSLRSNRPLWAEITVALAEKDKAATGQLLETFDERLPRYDRVNAAAAVGDIRRAQTAAFETQGDQPDDNPIHLQLTENLLAFSDHAGAEITSRQLDSIDEREAGAQLHLALTPRLFLDLRLLHIDRRARLPQTVYDPSPEDALQAELRWLHAHGSTVLRIARRESLAGYNSLQAEQEWRLDNRLTLRLDLGKQLPTQESLVLRMGGMKDRLGASLRYQPTRLDQFAVEHWRDKYQLQTGGQLGSGRHTALSYTHTYRLDAPTVDVGAFWSGHAYRRNDPAGLAGADLAFLRYLPPQAFPVGAGYFLPENFSFYGIQLSTNTRFERDYTRALRPFAAIARTWHSRQGPGYSLRLGFAGSLLGTDHLSLVWSLGKSGAQSPGRTREIQLNYRNHY
ncbi:tetratricopeptide repeat protein [Simplicispira lacusdiani]|uniref:tetratricopeptide repeat protein n=1 Tax=Simplicispira lacusdiani TaxID=2213010 RepID=UPI001E2A314F|nr:tetratricopeptide repeat protein [Simplicispira lacusdiani]